MTPNVRRRTAIGLTVCFSLTTTGPAFAKTPKDNPVPTPLAQLRDLKTKKVGSYFADGRTSDESMRAFAADLDAFRISAESVGAYDSTASFHAWWRAHPLSESQARALEDESVPAVAHLLYLAYATDHAKEVDQKSGEKRRPGEPTKGDLGFGERVGNLLESGGKWFLFSFMGGFVLKKLDEAFFFGTFTQMTNSALEPIVRPVRERIEQFTNTHIAPKTVGWAQWVSGENARRKKALTAAKNGTAKNTDEAERFLHPAISVEDFAEDHRIFYDEFMKADYRWRGWLANEYIRARNTGFELLYKQWTLLATEVSTYESNANHIRSILALDAKPELRRLGATDEEIAAFADAVKLKQETLVFVSPKSPELDTIDESIKSIMTSWRNKNITPEIIGDFYQLNVDLFVTKTRPAFALVAALDSERFYQENNLALKDLHQIQDWQEQAREMTGFYDMLEKYQSPIKRFYVRKGLKYDLDERIAQRGYPLGGPVRPTGARSTKYCRHLLEEVEAARTALTEFER